MSYVTCLIHLYALPHNRHLINLQEAKIWWVIFPHTNLSGYSCFAMASPILTINLFISKCFQKGPRSNQTRICYNNDPFMHSRTQSFPVAFFLIHIIFYYSCWREICHSPLRHGAPNTGISLILPVFSKTIYIQLFSYYNYRCQKTQVTQLWPLSSFEETNVLSLFPWLFVHLYRWEPGARQGWSSSVLSASG